MRSRSEVSYKSREKVLFLSEGGTVKVRWTGRQKTWVSVWALP